MNDHKTDNGELTRTDENSQVRSNRTVSEIEREFDRDRTALIPVGQGPRNYHVVEFRTVGDIMDYAKTMALDPTMPPHLRNKPATCLHVIHDARGWQMDEFKVALMSFVVNGSLCYMAQMSVAVINKHAPIKGRVRYSHSGEGDKRRCTAKATCADDGEVVEYTTPEIGKITPKNSPLWKTDPDQQLCYYAGRALCRRYFPDVLLGVYFRDEMVDNPRVVEHSDYQRIDNPLGGGEVASQTALVDVAGASDAEGVDSQPHDEKSTGGQNGGQDGSTKRRRKQTAPAAEFPQPYNRQPAESYVEYAKGWMASINDSPVEPAHRQGAARSRWNNERTIRNNLASPLNEDQLNELQAAMGRIGK